MASWLNYHHLLYFWTIVREGSVSAASRKLRLSQPTVSEQLKELEASLGVTLFHRRGGRLVLTESGSNVYRYADEIFTLGNAMQESLAGRAVARGTRLVVGIADVMPKLIVSRLLAPALDGNERLRLVCYEDRHERLLADLALYELDLVLTDSPSVPSANFPGHSRLLGESGVSLLAQPKLAEQLRRRFPESLDGVPMLMPIEHTNLRRSLTRWFDARGIRPYVRGEFQDSAMLMAIGGVADVVFAAPSVIAEEITRRQRLSIIAELEDVRERFYAITAERRATHPAVRAITARARGQLSQR
jgi:LysR family transcriptional activator of nhaA